MPVREFGGPTKGKYIGFGVHLQLEQSRHAQKAGRKDQDPKHF